MRYFYKEKDNHWAWVSSDGESVWLLGSSKMSHAVGAQMECEFSELKEQEFQEVSLSAGEELIFRNHNDTCRILRMDQDDWGQDRIMIEFLGEEQGYPLVTFLSYFMPLEKSKNEGYTQGYLDGNTGLRWL